MLDRHAVRRLLQAGLRPRQIAHQLGVSRRTVERIVHEPVPVDADDRAERRRRRIGRPGVPPAARETVRQWLADEPTLPPGEVWRRLREAGTPLGLSTTYRLIAEARQQIPAELMVRFEGVAGEFAQFDFGEVDVRLTSGARRRIHFAAYRLKWSRWIHVVVVPTERIEPLVRSLLASFEASGGVPLRVVFDNPRTVVIGREHGRPVWNGVPHPRGRRGERPVPGRQRAVPVAEADARDHEQAAGGVGAGAA